MKRREENHGCHGWARMAVGLASLTLAAEAWGAGWSTNCWPSTNFPRRLDQQIAEAYTATVERCWAAGVSAPSTNDVLGWRDERADLVDLKSAVKALVPYFVDTNRANSSGTFTDFYGSSNAVWVTSTIPVLSATGLCWTLKIPTNYFDYTPYRALTGGADGFTNTSTAAGGENFPEGRTNWLTTDYGTLCLPDVLNNLRWTRKATAQSNYSNWWTGAGTYPPAYPVWADATAKADSLWAEHTFASDNWGGVTKTYGRNPGWEWYNRAYEDSRLFMIQVTGLSTAVQHSAQIYLAGILVSQPTGDSIDSNEYYCYGEVMTNRDVGYLIYTADETNGATIQTGWRGSTNLPTPWCTAPASGRWTAKGYNVKPLDALIKWDGTNGFQYK